MIGFQWSDVIEQLEIELVDQLIECLSSQVRTDLVHDEVNGGGSVWPVLGNGGTNALFSGSKIHDGSCPVNRPSMAGHDGSIAALRTRIGEAAYDTAWSAGRHNSVGSAVAMAISLAERTMAELAGAVNGSGGPRAAALPGGLSEREAEVLRLAASGLSTHQMADRLFLSPNTIRAHLHRIYAKLEITNRAEATRYATDHGLL
jgi:DNA-binding CsgD family transcriptional regulator